MATPAIVEGYMQNGTAIADLLIWKHHPHGTLDAFPPIRVRHLGETEFKKGRRRHKYQKWEVLEGGFSLRSEDGREYIERVAENMTVEGKAVVLLTRERDVIVDSPDNVRRLPPIK